MTSRNIPSPRAIVVMGVSGCGKTTIASLLGEQLGWEVADADRFHPEANKEKMASAIPLTDEDRWPWLGAIRDWIETQWSSERSVIVACSALKESYRSVLAGEERERVTFVYLKGDFETIYNRLNERRGHFMKSDLLRSQFETLEEPKAALTVSIDQAPGEIVSSILEAYQHELETIGDRGAEDSES